MGRELKESLDVAKAWTSSSSSSLPNTSSKYLTKKHLLCLWLVGGCSASWCQLGRDLQSERRTALCLGILATPKVWPQSMALVGPSTSYGHCGRGIQALLRLHEILGLAKAPVYLAEMLKWGWAPASWVWEGLRALSDSSFHLEGRSWKQAGSMCYWF